MEEKSWKVHNDGTLEFRGVIFEIKDITEVRREHICANCPFFKIGDCRSQCRDTYEACEEEPDYQSADAVLVPKYPDIDKDVSSEEIDYKKLYEEEHKKYNDAVERAKEYCVVECIFPELEKESDESTLEGMITYFKSRAMTEWARWLESKKCNICQ